MFARISIFLLMSSWLLSSLGCAFAVHGPCKTLGYDARANVGRPGVDICVHDRCLGWMVGRAPGPFHYLRQGTTDPGCGPNNCQSLLGGNQTLTEAFPGAPRAVSPNQMYAPTFQTAAPLADPFR